MIGAKPVTTARLAKKGTLMCEVKGDVPLHLFDTFQGLPELDEIDRDFFREGWFEIRCSH
jgi:hypothetical protein